MNEELLNKYKVFLASRHRKKRTRTGYYHPVKKFSEWLNKPFKDITKDDLLRWMAYQNTQGFKHNGITIRVIAVNMFLAWIEKGHLKLPLPSWKPVNRHTIRLDDIKKLFTVATEPLHELVLRFITDLDARPESIINSKLSNIHGEKIYFDDTKTGDNYGFITRGFMDALDRYKQIRPVPHEGYEDYILLTTYGTRYETTYIIRKTVSELALRAEIPPIKPYDLRASVITEEFNNYINPKIIQRKARHKRPETTQKYNHISDEMVKEYVTFDLIFDKPSLYQKNNKKLDTKVYLDAPVLTQGLNKTLESEDTNRFSFSFSLFESMRQGVGS